MQVDSLESLKTAFHDWRSKKRHQKERVPEDLVMRARRCAMTYGASAVVRAVSIDYRRLAGQVPIADMDTNDRLNGARQTTALAAPTPSYSRLEFFAPQAPDRPVFEIETPERLKLRVFQMTAETVSLLSTISGSWRVS